LSAQRPYRIERDKPKCSECKRDTGWNVIGPNDVALSLVFEDEEHARDYADDLNDAYEAGLSAVAGVDDIKELRRAATAASGPLAEAVAEDMDDKHRDHSKWYRAVKRLRKALGA
jgi:hypothetical protein